MGSLRLEEKNNFFASFLYYTCTKLVGTKSPIEVLSIPLITTVGVNI